MQATLFDKLVAAFIRLTHIPVAVTELLFQFVSIFLIVLGCWCIARVLFKEARVQWAGVAMTASMLTLPVAGTALYLVDQHLHPRTIATALILLAVSRILAGHRWQAVPLLLVAFVLHPIMGALGISFCFLPDHGYAGTGPRLASFLARALASAVPLGWIFESPTPIWHRALETRRYFFLYRWTWYEWLGALAPLFLFWLLWRIALKHGDTILARFSLAVFVYGVFQQVVAMTILASPALVRLTPMQPMRFLHLIYFFLTLVGGCLLGKFLLKDIPWRWAVFLVLINAGMFAAQRARVQQQPAPRVSLGAVKQPVVASLRVDTKNTPVDAYFAMDPHYLAVPGEDYHSFRALAERSQLADMEKDPSVVTQVPELGPAWERQVDATAGWKRFNLADFRRLKAEFGVDWVIVSDPVAGLDCEWHEQSLAVCKIPENQLTTSAPQRRNISESPFEVYAPGMTCENLAVYPGCILSFIRPNNDFASSSLHVAEVDIAETRHRKLFIRPRGQEMQ